MQIAWIMVVIFMILFVLSLVFGGKIGKRLP